MTRAEDFSDEYLCTLLSMPDGSPAWPLARSAGVNRVAFVRRLQRGWDAGRAILPLRSERSVKPLNSSETEALEHGVSVRAYRARLRAGQSHDEASGKLAAFWRDLYE